MLRIYTNAGLDNICWWNIRCNPWWNLFHMFMTRNGILYSNIPKWLRPIWKFFVTMQGGACEQVMLMPCRGGKYCSHDTKRIVSRNSGSPILIEITPWHVLFHSIYVSIVHLIGECVDWSEARLACCSHCSSGVHWWREVLPHNTRRPGTPKSWSVYGDH